MNTIQITIQSALHTSAAIARKGKRDVEITYQFFTDEEMIKLYQAIWQTIYGVAQFCYGCGILSARAIDQFVQDSIVSEDVATEEVVSEEIVREEIVSEEIIFEETIADAIYSTVLELDNFFQSLPVEKMRNHLREIGQPYRVNNRRFNRSECIQQYKNYLDNLSE